MSALLDYQRAVCTAWTARGFKDTCFAKTLGLVCRWYAGSIPPYRAPPWLGDEELHRSHQSNLIRKDAGHYGVLFPAVSADEPYFWPVSKQAESISSAQPGYSAVMTAMPPEPVSADESPTDDEDQDAEPTSTAPEENNPTVPDPPD